MCTAITFKTNNFYFGRNLDLDRSYGEEVVITPRNYQFALRNGLVINNHYAMIGTAFVNNGYPLYYDASNEKGLCMAGLNFVKNACYSDEVTQKINLTQFEFVPYLLGRCSTVDEAEKEILKINITKEAFSPDLPIADLHWILADKNRCIIIEYVTEGLKIYDNPVGALTNNPPFNMQLFNLNNYLKLSPIEPKNSFSDKLDLSAYSFGMGALGLPGDLSSQSRFVRVAFTKLNSVSGDTEEEGVNQFFHLLESVQQPRGSNKVGNGYEITVYTSCCNADSGVYYYTTYENHCISAVDMKKVDLNGKELLRYKHIKSENITRQN